MSFFQNTCKPTGIGGKIMLNMMNKGHATLTEWALSNTDILDNYTILDAGCGGGANIKRMLNKCTSGIVKGIDYSELSVAKSKELNNEAIQNNQCEIIHGNILKTPFDNNTFDLITAIETIYFWPDIQNAFKEMYRILKPEGRFLICNELSGENKLLPAFWQKLIKGMNMYRNHEITNMLADAGFIYSKTFTKYKNWVCFTAEKQA